VSRGSTHPPISVEYVLDRITDPDQLRELARQWHDAMLGPHELAQHLLEIADCPQCSRAARYCEDDLACDRYRAWQAQYAAALRAI
jgi:hypothetical protein